MKLRVQNFQTAKDTTLDIKGFTVIIGKSNTGKTSLLRAAEASIFNDSITSCVRHGEKDATVTVELPSLAYTWEKGETKNGYQITTDKGTKEYSKVGFQVPDEIPKYGFREFKIDGETYPIRPQFAEWHSPIFLLNKSGKVITELMASVTRLDVINMAIRKCSTNLRRDKSTLKVREGDNKKAKRRALDFEVLDAVPTKAIEALYQECKDIEQSITVLDSYIQKKDRLDASIIALDILDGITIPDQMPTDFDRKLKDLDLFIAKFYPLQDRLKAMEALDTTVVPNPIPTSDLDALRLVSDWSLKTDQYRTKLEAMKDIDLVLVPTMDLEGAVSESDMVCKWLKDILTYSVDIKKSSEELSLIEGQLNKDEATLLELRGKIETCPVCGKDGHE